MTNKQLIKSFIEGATKGKCNNLKIIDNLLYSYNVVIVERVMTSSEIHWHVNPNKYSHTTTIHVNTFKRILARC